MSAKYSINLLQDELLPVYPLLTLPRVFLLWAIVLFIMIFAAVMVQSNERSLALEAAQLADNKKQQEQKLESLKQQLVKHKPSAELIAKEQTLQHLITNKKSIYRYLTNTEESYIDGFAKAMSDLALLHHRDISLTDIRINDSLVSFAGVARNAESVPSWLTNFERSNVLSGRLFNHFQLNENEDKYINFTVSSFAQKEQN